MIKIKNREKYKNVNKIVSRSKATFALRTRANKNHNNHHDRVKEKK